MDITKTILLEKINTTTAMYSLMKRLLETKEYIIIINKKEVRDLFTMYVIRTDQKICRCETIQNKIEIMSVTKPLSCSDKLYKYRTILTYPKVMDINRAINECNFETYMKFFKEHRRWKERYCKIIIKG